MKLLILGSLLFSAPTFAQSMSLAGLKDFMTSKKDTIESVRVGMTKKVVTKASADVNGGKCNYMVTSTQSILKIEGEKLVILANETFSPANTPACLNAGYQAFKESMLYYEAKPTLSQDLSDLDESASAIKSILRAGNLVTISMSISDVDEETNTTFTDNVTMKYDFSKSSFNNLLSTEGNGYTIQTQDVADINLATVNLKNVLFCENGDEDRSDCVEGDFSDILY